MAALEIEVKILEVDQTQIAAQIERLGGRLEGDWFLKTYIYDFPDRRLLARKSYIRIRNEEANVWHCTMKRVPQNIAMFGHDAKVREELDTIVSDPAVAAEILGGLGLEQTLYFEKKRRHYRYGTILFDLDELPGIPPYLEIESDSLAKVQEGLALLGIPPDRAVTWGPRELLAHYQIDVAQIRELTFTKS